MGTADDSTYKRDIGKLKSDCVAAIGIKMLQVIFPATVIPKMTADYEIGDIRTHRSNPCCFMVERKTQVTYEVPEQTVLMDFDDVNSERLDNLDTNDLLTVLCGEPLCLVPCKFDTDFLRLCLGLSETSHLSTTEW